MNTARARTVTVTAAVAAGLAVLSACQSDPGSAPPGAQPTSSAPTDLTGSRFTGQAKGAPLTVSFLDGRITANAGCNHIGGPVDTSGGSINVTEVSTTEMGCDAERHARDEWLQKFLTAKPTWRLDGEKLTLSSAAEEVVLTKQAAKPLAGTTWTLDTLVSGDVAGSAPAAGDPATLKFDGTEVSVDTGCNQGRAPYRVDGDKLVVGPPMMTKKACEQMDVETAVLAVLSGRGDQKEVLFHIDGDILELNSEGKGLRLRAS